MNRQSQPENERTRMQVTILKSKIHRATITEASLHYEGSITLPRRLVEMAGMHLFEKVLVDDKNQPKPH